MCRSIVDTDDGGLRWIWLATWWTRSCCRIAPTGRSLEPWRVEELRGQARGAFREAGYEATAPRSRAPRRLPHRIAEELEDHIITLRKELSELGVGAGAVTIARHLGRRRQVVPSVSTYRLADRDFAHPPAAASPDF